MTIVTEMYGGRIFDRVPYWDERNHLYTLSTVQPETSAKILRSRTWHIDKVLDQGTEGACTGFGTAHMLRSTPASIRDVDDAYAIRLYREAQKLDEWEGEGYEGSSVLGAMKAAKVIGRVSSYAWLQGTSEVALGVGYHGPVVIGVDWYSQMINPDASGRLHVEGSIIGGHCVAVIGYSMKTGDFTIINSWGSGWGRNGTAVISSSDMSILLNARSAEAALAKKVRP